MLTVLSVSWLDRKLDTFGLMPKIEFKEETLNGRASIIGYADREYLTLRIPRGNKKYSHISLQTTDVKIAHDRALDVYAATINQPLRSRSGNLRFAKICEEFLEWKQERSGIGEIRDSAVKTYSQRIYQRIIPYAEKAGVRNIADIKKQSFEDYGMYYRKVETKGKWKTNTQGLSVSTINSDLTTLNDLMGWMVKRNILDANDLPIIQKLRNKKEFKEDANPAFMPDEWDAVKACLNEFVKSKDGDDEIIKWRRRWIYNWIFFMYHFGGRFHEGMMLTIGDTSVRKIQDGKLKGIVQVSPQTKTGKRTVVMNGHWLNSVKSHLRKGVRLRNEQIEEHNKIVNSGEIKKYRWRFQGKIPLLAQPNKDTLLFLNPIFHTINKEDKRDMKRFEQEGRFDQVRWEVSTYSSEHIRKKYQLIVKDALTSYYKGEEKPTAFKKFTLHSLRSTHVTHQLLNGVRIRLISDNVGNSESEIERTYYRLNNLLNIEELGMHRKRVPPQDDLVGIIHQ